MFVVCDFRFVGLYWWNVVLGFCLGILDFDFVCLCLCFGFGCDFVIAVWL